MVPPKNQIFLGLTGSFGSGCKTLMKSLKKLGFKGFSLSEYVWQEWEKRNPGKSRELALRRELQMIGNDLREKYGNNYLAKKAIDEARHEIDEGSSIVFKSIRNIGEVEEFRKEFPDFYLIAVDCPTALRWERVRDNYEKHKQTEYDFQEDDQRDKYEEGKDNGQQVELCVDAADILIQNHINYPSEEIAVDKLQTKIEEYIDLIAGKKKRTPTPMESYMNMAYSAAANSRCIKRKVGAVIVDEKEGSVLASGYNEAPAPTEPCAIKYAGRCFRDIYKERYFKDLEKKGQTCPKCGERLINIVYPFHHKCGFDLDKYFIRDKALNRCRALHAEEKAILSMGTRNTEGLTLYTTTFPCFSCSKRIVQGKIRNIIYVEPYPDEESIEILKEANVAVNKFEGVKARAYFRLFGS
jgi:deoxycytidylate deaminase